MRFNDDCTFNSLKMTNVTLTSEYFPLTDTSQIGKIKELTYSLVSELSVIPRNDLTTRVLIVVRCT